MSLQPLVGLMVCVLIAGCAAPVPEAADRSSPSVSQSSTTHNPDSLDLDLPWGHDAVLFFDALHYARAGDRADHFGRFYTASATFEDGMFGAVLEGRKAIGESIGRWDRSPATVQQLYLSIDGAAAVTEVHIIGIPKTAIGLSVFHIQETRIAREHHEASLAELVTDGYARADHVDRVRDLYERYVTAWASGDDSRIAATYTAHASRRDGLFGGSRVIGEEWTESLPWWLRMGETDAHLEAAYSAPTAHASTVSPAVYSVPTRTDPDLAHALVSLNIEGCRIRLLADWRLDDYLIAEEEISYEVESLRMCAPALGVDRLPAGWWSGLELPDPFIEHVTAHLALTNGATIAVVNAGRRQIDLVEWGLSRFDLASLPAPQPDVMAFPPAVWCARGVGEYAGIAVFEPDTTRVELCLGESEICTEPLCEIMRADARFGLLHELAHVWERQFVDDTTRDEFLTLLGLEVWSLGDQPWVAGAVPEGVEQAADIIAWALMDEEIELARLPGVTREQLSKAFNLLTQTTPPRR